MSSCNKSVFLTVLYTHQCTILYTVYFLYARTSWPGPVARLPDDNGGRFHFTQILELFAIQYLNTASFRLYTACDQIHEMQLAKGTFESWERAVRPSHLISFKPK